MTRTYAPGAKARWHEAKAARMREAGIPERAPDMREAWVLDLRPLGGKCWQFEPIPGLQKWRARNMETDEIRARGAIKTLLRAAADSLPRELSQRHQC